jgi:ABC-type uncharacterized transport system permease subunit
MAVLIYRIAITLVALCYLVAWLLHLTRSSSHDAMRRACILTLVIVGFVTHTLYLGYRAAAVSQTPLSSSRDWCLLAAWLLMATFLYTLRYYPRAAIGLYLLPLELGLVGTAALLADDRPFAIEPASRVWAAVHGVFLLLGAVAVMVGFVAGVMYLIQASRLKRKLPAPLGLRVPSLEWLEHVNSRALLVSALMVAVGFVAGIILNMLARAGTGQLRWTDPVVLSSGLMLAWLVAASIFSALYRPARAGRKVAYLTVASFFFLVLALGSLLVFDTEHTSEQLRPGRVLNVDPRVNGIGQQETGAAIAAGGGAP